VGQRSSTRRSLPAFSFSSLLARKSFASSRSLQALLEMCSGGGVLPSFRYGHSRLKVWRAVFPLKDSDRADKSPPLFSRLWASSIPSLQKSSPARRRGARTPAGEPHLPDPQHRSGQNLVADGADRLRRQTARSQSGPCPQRTHDSMAAAQSSSPRTMDALGIGKPGCVITMTPTGRGAR
jgi:hypothetical protein